MCIGSRHGDRSNHVDWPAEATAGTCPLTERISKTRCKFANSSICCILSLTFMSWNRIPFARVRAHRCKRIELFTSPRQDRVAPRLRGPRLLRARVVYLEELAKLAFTVASYLEELLDQFDGLLLGICLKEGEAADHLLGFRERPVGHGQLATGEAHPGP